MQAMSSRLQNATEAMSRVQKHYGSISALGTQLTVCDKADQAAALEALEEHVHQLEDELQQVHHVLGDEWAPDRLLSYESCDSFEDSTID
jgi:hypothetical protein